MAEVKQTNFRLDQEQVEKFRKFCDDNHFNQSDGFSFLMNLIDVKNTMVAAPKRQTEIEAFQKHLKDMTQIYLNSVDLCTNAEERIRDEYLALIESKDITIIDLQAKVKELEDGYDAAKATSDQAAKDAAQAVKDAEAAKKQADTTDQLCREKEETIAGLKEKLADREALKTENEVMRERISEMETLRGENEELKRVIAANKADADRKAADAEREHSDALKDAARELQAEKESSKRALADVAKDHEAAINALRMEMEHKISDAKKDAALEMAERLREVEKENAKETATLQARIKELEDRIRSLQASTRKSTNNG